MQFSSTILAFAGLLTLSLAAPEPQTPAQTTQAAAALVSYVESLQTDPALLSIASAYATNTAGLASLLGFQSSIQSIVDNQETPAADFLKALPTDVQPFFGSVFTAEMSIASKYGFTSAATGAATATDGVAAATVKSTSSGSDAAPTKAVGLAAAGLVGFVGAVMAL